MSICAAGMSTQILLHGFQSRKLRPHECERPRELGCVEQCAAASHQELDILVNRVEGVGRPPVSVRLHPEGRDAIQCAPVLI